MNETTLQYILICEADKLIIEQQLSVFYSSVNRLLLVFSEIEAESEEIESETLKKLSASFNPEISDEADIYENSFFAGNNHYLEQQQMKQAFVNVSTLWLYHLFDQQLNCISLKVIHKFDYTQKNSITRITNCLKEKNLNSNIHWKKIHNRLVAPE